MLQAWMPIFDIGLTPVLSREMSRFRAGALTAREAATRLRTLEVVLGALAIFSVALLWVGSDWIGHNWLSAVTLSGETLAHCVALIGVAVALRWFAGLQRAVLIGLEHQGWVNGLTAGFATLRFAGVLPLLLYVSTSPEHFFAFQVVVGGLELTVFVMIAHHHVPGGAGVRPDSHGACQHASDGGQYGVFDCDVGSHDADRQVDPVGAVAFGGIWLFYVGCHGCQRGSSACRPTQPGDPAAPDHTG